MQVVPDVVSTVIPVSKLCLCVSSSVTTVRTQLHAAVWRRWIKNSLVFAGVAMSLLINCVQCEIKSEHSSTDLDMPVLAALNLSPNHEGENAISNNVTEWLSQSSVKAAMN